MKAKLICLIIYLLFFNCLFCYDSNADDFSSSHRLSVDDAIVIASQEARKIHLDLGTAYISITLNDLPLYMFTYNLAAVESGTTSNILYDLSGKDYYAVNIYYNVYASQPSKKKEYKNICFFIDQASGSIIKVYNEDDIEQLEYLGDAKALQIAINEIINHGFNIDDLDILTPFHKKNEQTDKLEGRLYLSVVYNDKKLAYKLVQREHWNIYLYPKGKNPSEKYICVIIDKFTGAVIGVQEGKEPVPARNPIRSR